jgi:hypothetical protein
MPEVNITCPVCGACHSVQLTVAQSRSQEPFVFQCPDLDRRYRLINFYVDSRRDCFTSDDLLDHTNGMSLHLKSELGEHDFDAKFERWKQIDYPTLGLIDEYPEKLAQIISTYCIGYAYPAVTAACCLAERILNRLVLRCRDHFKSHLEYKKTYRKSSFDDWGRMLDLIGDWQLVPLRAVDVFRDLMPIRHQSIHYNEAYDFDAVAPDAINKLIAGVTEVFGVMNRKDIYLVFEVPGEVWVRSEAESLPFVKEFVIPHCYYAHAVHDVDFHAGKITERLGKTGRLSDREFVELRKAAENSPPSPNGT